jgi:hypothetical protein
MVGSVRFATVAISFCILACDSEDQKEQPQSVCAGVEDSKEGLPCSESLVCPAGFTCNADDDGSKGECSLLLCDRDSYGNLSKVLRVPEFDLRSADNATETEPHYIWTRPAEAEDVVCALFVCEPRVAQGRIVNFGQCAYASRQFSLARSSIMESGEFSFGLASLEAGEVKQCPPSELDNRGPVVNSLSVGCWAFGETEIVAGTALLPVSPAALPGYNLDPVDDTKIIRGSSPLRFARFRGASNVSCSGVRAPTPIHRLSRNRPPSRLRPTA